jgi:hypothetical protein
VKTVKSSGGDIEAKNRPGDRYFRTRIAKISEADFWSAWSGADPRLRQACTLGRSGRRAAAYLALADFHREVTGAEWEHAVLEARQRTASPRKRREVFAKATDARKGLVGYCGQVVRMGKRLDFNAPFGRSGQYGFHYLYWLVPLVDRFLVRNDGGDLARVVDIVEQYYAQRNGLNHAIPGLHPVYYELGAWAKTSNLLPAYLAMIHAGRPRPAAVEAFLKLFLGFGRSLLRLQESGYRGGNWQIVGAAALFRLGAALPHLREATAWRRRATEIMLAHLRRDFYVDGGHKERCWTYGWMSLKGVLDLCESGRRSGLLAGAPARECLRGVRRAFRWFLGTMAPGGICPAYGDGDLFKADEILTAAARYLPPAEVAAKPAASVLFKPSGYAVMRDDQGRCLNLNFGESGGAHTHRDLLDFNAWAFGEPLIEEVGRFDSYDHPLNPFFCSPEAHNQVVIDHHFMDRHPARGRGVRWVSRPELDYFRAWHGCFRHARWPARSAEAARVHRHVLFVRRGYWLIYDVVEPAEKASTIFSISSFLHSPWPFRLLGPGLAAVRGRRGRGLIAFAPAEAVRRLETGVDVAASEVTVPRLYGERHFLRARTWGPTACRGSLRLATLVYPCAGRMPRVSIRQVPMRGIKPGAAEAFEVRTPAGRDLVVFNPGRLPGIKIGGRPVRGELHWRRGRRRVTLP